MKRRFTAITPDGRELQRETARTYTHAVVTWNPTKGRWGLVGFSSSKALANKRADQWRKNLGWQTEVVPANET